MKSRNLKPKAKPTRYGYIGVRPMPGVEERLTVVKALAEKAGERKTLSGLVNECIVAHLDALETKYA